MSLTAANSPVQQPTSRRACWLYVGFVAVIAPIAEVVAVGHLANGRRWEGAVLTVALVFGGLFALIPRASSVQPGAALAGFLLSACLAVPWGVGLIGALIFLSCRGQEQCFS